MSYLADNWIKEYEEIKKREEIEKIMKKVEILETLQSRKPTTKIEKVIVQSVDIGSGIESNPCRQVKRYWDLKGNFLFEKED